ncbi:interleukin-1 receptor-like 1 [Thalassophryne amazonica]|uniref:interleukin-1 receptor-like 1 n=1 Tax=Thalassophryne amazonica TaxID=390379 RepID=UPI0014717EA4|nr:interleukin-1 receptor-like 1 [Thalassophryne amazonica]
MLGSEKLMLLEGQAFHHVLRFFSEVNPEENFTWYKNHTQIKHLSSEEDRSVHYHGPALFLLNISTEDSGTYICQLDFQGKCYYSYLKIKVFPASCKMNRELFYNEINHSGQNKKVPCPLEKLCKVLTGSYTWYRNFTLLEGEHDVNLYVNRATKDDEGIYTCVCTWTHNQHTYNSSASRMLMVEEDVFNQRPEIISPIIKEQFTNKGDKLVLNCSVRCGVNAHRNCHAEWKINGGDAKVMQGYNTVVIPPSSKITIATMILTIERVSADDFESNFTCFGLGLYEATSATLNLKPRASMTLLIMQGLCALFLCILVAAVVKCFDIDLALLFRRCFPLSRGDDDGKVYDAYVVYQMPSSDKDCEERLCHFVTKMLPSVLEKECGYRLFIQGRDDVPGEDHLELVEARIKKSRRLMVILLPASQSGLEITDQCQISLDNPGRFDWQVGLHEVLFQSDMSIILIQLGDTGPQGYKHLPPGLQHLIRKSAPLRWPAGACCAVIHKSRFWKRVRYLMPAMPVKQHPCSAIV